MDCALTPGFYMTWESGFVERTTSFAAVGTVLNLSPGAAARASVKYGRMRD